MPIKRRALLVKSAALTSGLFVGSHAQALGTGLNPNLLGYTPSTMIVWNRALTAAVVATSMPAAIAGRACSMVYEAAYNAWAAYDAFSQFTLTALRKRPSVEWATPQKQIAVSWAMYTVLVDLFPTQKVAFDTVLLSQAGGPASTLLFGIIARQVGQTAGYALLQSRHQDGSNQLGDLAPGPYADYSGYAPVNTPDLIVDPTRWQPLRYVDLTGVTRVQKFVVPFWGRVRPFALSSGSIYRPTMDHLAPSSSELVEMLTFSSELDDTRKALVDYFAQNPGHGSPPTQWMGFVEQVSANDRHTLDADVMMFFATGQAVLDAGIAAWDVKRAYDSVRPITAVPYYLAGQTFTAWAGYNQGVRQILADNWYPYQPPNIRTPSFPEFVSAHSTFSRAAAVVIAGLRGSDNVTISGVVAPGTISFETNVPASQKSFSWPTLSAVAAAAGLSRRQCGIHFEQGDLKGRALGAKVGATVLAKCQTLFGRCPTSSLRAYLRPVSRTDFGARWRP